MPDVRPAFNQCLPLIGSENGSQVETRGDSQVSRIGADSLLWLDFRPGVHKVRPSSGPAERRRAEKLAFKVVRLRRARTIGMKKLLVAGLTAALAFGLYLNVDVGAQSAPTAPVGSRTAAKDDITDQVRDKSISIKAGLVNGDSLDYSVWFIGDVVASSGDAAARSNTTNQVVLTAAIKRPTGDNPKHLDAEIKFKSINIQSVSSHPGAKASKTVSVVAHADTEEGTGIWVDGVSKDTDPPKGYPTPSTLKTNMSKPAGHCEVVEDSQAMRRPSHGARFDTSDTSAESIPQRVVDPVVAMRLIFAGWAGHEFKLGSEVSFETMLSTDVAGGSAVPYTIRLIPDRAFGPDAENIERVSASIRCTPKEGSTMTIAGVEMPAPALAGKIQIDVKRGVPVALELDGTYQREQAPSVSGTIRIAVDLVPKAE